MKLAPYGLLITCCLHLFALASRADIGQNASTGMSPIDNEITQLSFLENKGQIWDQFQEVRTDIDVKLETGNGLVIFIGGGTIHYQWTKSRSQNSNDPSLGQEKEAAIEAYRMDVELLGANRNALLVKSEKQEYFERYYAAWTGEEGAVVHGYRRLVYRDVYPNIDWVLYTDGNGLKYDFVVHPGGDPSDIQLQYQGASALAVENGTFKASTPMGVITEAAPYSYEAVTQRTIPSSFKLQENIISFDVASYQGKLVIDPALTWATYYGGSNNDYLRDVAVDRNDFVYIVGVTSSTTNIATTGTHQTTISPNTHSGMLVKFNGRGQRQWGTYYGGNRTAFKKFR